MNQNQPGASPGGMKLGDILYIIFRHKWKITLISTVAILAALLLPKINPASYQSEVRIYIRYILENKNPGETGENDPRIKSIDNRGDSIINNELEILTSLDLAQKVAELVGPDQILGRTGGSNSVEAAALAIRGNLSAEPAKNSSVIHIVFKHKNRQVVRPVLQNLVECYFKKHSEIHAVGAFDEALTQETDQLRTRLAQTEEELRKAKNKVGVISLADSQKAFTAQISKIQEEILDAEAQLAESQGAVRAISSLTENVPGTAPQTNQAVAATDFTVPGEKVAEYRRVTGMLERLQKKEQDLLVVFTPVSSFVKDVREQITATEKQRKLLELENPGLTVVKMTESRDSIADPTTNPRLDLITATARVTALESKMKVLTAQLDKIRKEALVVDEAQGPITELQRRKEIEESDFKRYHESLKKSEIDERLGAGKVSNISIIQVPSTPIQDRKNLRKAMAVVLFGGIAAAFGLAFLIELFLDQSIRRPTDIEGKLGVPLFLSIPRLPTSGHPRSLAAGGKRMPLLAQNKQDSNHGGNRNSQPQDSPAKGTPSMEMTPWDPQHSIQPFSEALRDRLITYFEMNNLTHKPKLVAVTGCVGGSGVSTIAAGLAASLSETGEGNVLLVDMNQQNGAAHHFYRGDLACDLEDALEAEKRDDALVQENLYVVSESHDNVNLPRILPKRFKNLVPKLKASDFDYIIFDMPPVSQISLTPRLAKFMDMVLMVVESEKTDRELLKRAIGLLSESKANLGVVLNKNRSYVPRRLQPQF